MAKSERKRRYRKAVTEKPGTLEEAFNPKGFSVEQLQYLQRAWLNPRVSTPEICQTLKASKYIVHRQALFLGLPRRMPWKIGKGKDAQVVFAPWVPEKFKSKLTPPEEDAVEPETKVEIIRSKHAPQFRWSVEQDRKILETKGRYESLYWLAQEWDRPIEQVQNRYLMIRIPVKITL